MSNALDREYSPGFKFVIINDHLLEVRRITTQEAAELVGCERIRAWKILTEISRHKPLYRDGEWWVLLEDKR